MNDKSGVLLGQGQYDWIAGGNSAIVNEILVPNGDWKLWHIEHNIQWTGSYDTEFCVTFSALEVLGSLFMYYLAHNMISPDNVLWLKNNGYFKNGFINFNERFTAILGGTTTEGAYQYKVANAIKNYGFIPQDMFQLAPDFNDNIDPKFITQAMYDLGKEFLKRFSINYEWVTDVPTALKSSPVQMIVRFADYVNPTDILAPQGDTNHAVKGVYSVPQYNEIEDTYWQVYKRYNPDFTHSFLAYHLTVNNNIPMDTQTFLKANDQKWVRNTNTGAFGRILQGKLFLLPSTDRATLALLDDKVRTNGIQISDAEWKQLPQTNF